MVSVLGAVTLLLFLLVAFSASRSWVDLIDKAFLQGVVSLRSEGLTANARFLDVVGSGWVLIPIRVLIAGFLILRRRWWDLGAFAFAMLLAEIVSGPIHALYERPRPPEPLVPAGDQAFPSRHALGTASTAVAAALILSRPGRGRYIWTTLAVGFALLMALSRTYLAVHWASDGVAGVLAGSFCAAVALFIVDRKRNRRRKDKS
jgi:membrane-associated phospholipid phosphatase